MATPEAESQGFDQRFRQDFEGLLFIGKLTDTFTWLGHRFTIRTIPSDDLLEMGLLHKPYVGTIADVKAYQMLVVAACIVAVDDQPPPFPVTNETTDTLLLNRFNFVRRSWFPPTVDVIYERYLLLEKRVEDVIEEMGKVFGSTDSTPTSTAESAMPNVEVS